MSLPDNPTPACRPIDCVANPSGPCSAEAPPWPRVRGCSPAPLACATTTCAQRNLQLRMRRKAEVLQHTRNAHQLSRKQKWSRLVTGVAGARRGRWATQSDLLTDPNAQKLPQGASPFTLMCGDAPLIHRPTTASDVPGRIMSLWLDKRLPSWGVGPPRRVMQGGTWRAVT